MSLNSYNIIFSFIKVLGLIALLIVSVTSQTAIRPNWRNYPIYSEARKSMMRNDHKESIDLLEKAIIEGKDDFNHLNLGL